MVISQYCTETALKCFTVKSNMQLLMGIMILTVEFIHDLMAISIHLLDCEVMLNGYTDE